SCVNALSEWLKLTIWRGGKTHEIEFRRGERVEPLAVTGETERSGTRVHFLADDQIFENIEYHYEIFAKRLRELSFLNNCVKLRLINERQGKSHDIACAGGVRAFVEHINSNMSPLHPNIFAVSTQSRNGEEPIGVYVARQLKDGYAESTLCFTNIT